MATWFAGVDKFSRLNKQFPSNGDMVAAHLGALSSATFDTSTLPAGIYDRVVVYTNSPVFYGDALPAGATFATTQGVIVNDMAVFEFSKGSTLSIHSIVDCYVVLAFYSQN